MLMLCLFAIPLGFAAGAIDTALNNYVALHYSAMQMSFLHCAYGVGVTVSPFIMSRVIESSAGWRGGYRIAFMVQMIIAATVFATLAIWKKVKHSESGDGEEEEIKALNIVQTLKIPGVKAACCVFVTSCALEFICGVWGSTFLVEARGLNVAAAASIVMFYYLGMTVGRFLSGVLSTRLSSWRIIFLGIVCLGVAIVILALPLPPYISAVGLFLVGLGNGPLFPNFQYLTPKTFGKSVSQSVIGAELAFSYIGIMVAPALFGVIGQVFTMELFPYALLLMYIGLVTSTVLTKKISSKKV
jgi:fucose permease